jgi:hydroxypyruvate reductase
MSADNTTLRLLFDAGVQAVGGETATARALKTTNFVKPVHLVAIGKAADSMAKGALQIIGNRLATGLVITKHGYLSPALAADARLVCLQAGHPTPDQASLDAGQVLVQTISTLAASDHLLLLISGGTSALVEHLVQGMALAELQAVTNHLLANGYAIGDMNRVRRRLSCIKGGRLANYLPAGCLVSQLLISDVPGDQPADIGSGLLIAPGSDTADSPEPQQLAQQVAKDRHLLNSLIDTQLIDSVTEAPAATAAVWAQIETRIIASSAIAQAAVAAAATARGLTVIQASGNLDGDVAAVADRICAVLLATDAAAGIYIWGGETTVSLPASPGRGGRNQHLALILAMRVAGMSGVQLLCCGTDGSDGPTGDAGGLVSGDTLRTGESMQLDAAASLRQANAGDYLERCGALVTTGPTGTNVMDLVIAIRS